MSSTTTTTTTTFINLFRWQFTLTILGYVFLPFVFGSSYLKDDTLLAVAICGPLLQILAVVVNDEKPNIGAGLFGWLLGIVGYYIVSVIFGAPVLDGIFKTLSWASWHCGLLIVGSVTRNGGIDQKMLQRVWIEHQPQNLYEMLLYYQIIGINIGAWCGALPIPLDWDRPWQKWPTTLCIGSVSGYFVSCFVFIIRNWSLIGNQIIPIFVRGNNSNSNTNENKEKN
jgi:hypothetical protein